MAVHCRLCQRQFHGDRLRRFRSPRNNDILLQPGIRHFIEEPARLRVEFTGILFERGVVLEVFDGRPRERSPVCLGEPEKRMLGEVIVMQSPPQCGVFQGGGERFQCFPVSGIRPRLMVIEVPQ